MMTCSSRERLPDCPLPPLPSLYMGLSKGTIVALQKWYWFFLFEDLALVSQNALSFFLLLEGSYGVGKISFYFKPSEIWAINFPQYMTNLWKFCVLICLMENLTGTYWKWPWNFRPFSSVFFFCGPGINLQVSERCSRLLSSSEILLKKIQRKHQQRIYILL